MTKARIWLILVAMALLTYSCATSCGPGPGQSTAPVSYPSDYRLEKQGEKSLSK